jgi:Protein of unknown function (DUF2530)
MGSSIVAHAGPRRIAASLDRVNAPRRPAPPPLEGDDLLITAVITAAWVVALVVLLIVRDRLPPADRWWVWVAVAGVCMGGFGLGYVPHLKKSRERAEAAHRSQVVTPKQRP